MKRMLLITLSLTAASLLCTSADAQTRYEKTNTSPAGKATASPPLDPIERHPDERPVFSLLGIGTQNYSCQAKSDDKTQFEWSATPEADLYDDKGVKVVRHRGGPTWESLDGTSSVVGDKAKAGNAHAAGVEAIDWLYLPAKSHSGAGILSNVTSIQRINTVGGKGPSGPCDPANSKPVSVFYSATYYFNVAK